MTELRATNRAMFWRILRRLLGANRGRLFVMLLALGAGAAVTAALLNLQVDAKRRITKEFRAFGANVIIAPRDPNRSDASSPPNTIQESLLQRLPTPNGPVQVPAAAFLYAVADVTAYKGRLSRVPIGSGPAVLVGARFVHDDSAQLLPHQVLNPDHGYTIDAETCDVGANVAAQFHLDYGAILRWTLRGKEGGCLVSDIWSFGSAEDNQIFLPLKTVQDLVQLPGQVSLIQLSIPGTSRQIAEYVASLQQEVLNAEVHPIRQFTEGEAKIYNRINGLLTATVAIVLLLTALCVMAAMTNVAMERKMDVGLMKAVGGATRRVIRLFLVEAALLGLAGGLLGAAVGIFLSIGLGKAVFGVAARPRLIVYPVAVGLTMLVAILSAFPLRRLASIRPASVFRGEA